MFRRPEHHWFRGGFCVYWLFRDLDNEDFFFDEPVPMQTGASSVDEESLDEKKVGVFMR